MKKLPLIASAAAMLGAERARLFAPAAPSPAEPTATPGVTHIADKPRGKRPIATIGTPGRDWTPAQRQAFTKMKKMMKGQARSIRYQQGLSLPDDAPTE